jgi:hypothetical protein
MDLDSYYFVEDYEKISKTVQLPVPVILIFDFFVDIKMEKINFFTTLEYLFDNIVFLWPQNVHVDSRSSRIRTWIKRDP